MAKVIVYSKSWCPFCVRAKQLLSQLGAAVDEIDLDKQPELRQKMVELSGQRTVPQIWIDGYHVGGCDELFALHQTGDLTRLLAAS